MKLKDVFEKSVQFFKDKKIESARLDAEILLAHVLKIERLQIYLKFDQPLSELEIQNCRNVIKRRSMGEPVAYIIGEKGFYREIFKVGEGVLIPRPETELIVEEALQFIQQNQIQSPKILDIGAGTGCIGFSILKNCPEAKLVSIEKSEKAFSYLKKNQELLQLTTRSELILADALDFNASKLVFDVVVANPPYIATNDAQTELNVKKYEPEQALFAEQEGYADLMKWSFKYKENLNNKGLLLFEIGYQQGDKIKSHFLNYNFFNKVEILKDLSGLDRVIKATHNK